MSNQDIFKTVDSSKTESVQIVLPRNANGSDRLFGGQLMEWIDIVAAVVARRHSECQVTTAAFDNLIFKNPAKQNDTILLIGKICYVGNTSMEVCVEAFVEKLSGKRTLINKAYCTLVALDCNGVPTRVPRLLIQNEDEQKEYDLALQRRNSK